MNKGQKQRQIHAIKIAIAQCRAIRKEHSKQPLDQRFTAYHPVLKTDCETTLGELDDYIAELIFDLCAMTNGVYDE